jgi:putative flavoprotein involved in K+ transport
MKPASAGSRLDVLVIGGGQAGLAIGYHLAQTGLRFQILDAGAPVGFAWRSRWDSLRLFTPAQYDNLPVCRSPPGATSTRVRTPSRTT